jgi:phosphatidylglycerophosphatase A
MSENIILRAVKKSLHRSLNKPSGTNKNFKRGLWWWIATWFGCGLSPVVSGTAGSLGALPFAYVIQFYFGNTALFCASIIMFLIGWWASNEYLRHTGRDDDPREIVVDEVAAQWLLLSVLFPTWQSYLIGFVLFRAFDIVKPWPISVADREIHGGFGVMFDDTLAALYPIMAYAFLFAFGPADIIFRVMSILGLPHVR